MCRVQPKPQLFYPVEDPKGLRRSYGIGGGFWVSRSRMTDDKWGLFFDEFEVPYLLTAQFKKPRTERTSKRFGTVREAVDYAQSVLECPKSMKALMPFLEAREEATACSGRRRA